MIVQPTSEQWAWLNGHFVPWHAATIHVSDHHYGVGVFEGIRAYRQADGGAAIFRLREHTKRLFDSARIVGIPVPESWTPAVVERAQCELLHRSGLRDSYLRPFVFRGGAMGLGPSTNQLDVHVALLALEWRRPSNPTGRGLVLQTATLRHAGPGTLPTRAKVNAGYLTGILAGQEARRVGADDALLLSTEGFVCETSGANVFAVKDGVLLTPPGAYALRGITRDTIMTIATELGVTVREQLLTRDDLYVADELFITGTAAEVSPVRCLDGISYFEDVPGPITRALRNGYTDCVGGRDPKHQDWLTRVGPRSAG